MDLSCYSRLLEDLLELGTIRDCADVFASMYEEDIEVREGVAGRAVDEIIHGPSLSQCGLKHMGSFHHHIFLVNPSYIFQLHHHQLMSD